jgi:hypothetical protein
VKRPSKWIYGVSPTAIHRQSSKHKKMLSSFSGRSLDHDRIHEIEREDSLSFHIVTLSQHCPNLGHIVCSAQLASANPLDLIDINLLSTLSIIVVAVTPVLVELEIAVSFSLLSVCIGLVDLGAFWEFTVCFQRSGFVGAVLEDNVAFLVLVVAEREKDDVPLVDPDLLSELASDVCETLGAIEAERFETTVSEHLEDLCVFCRRGGVSVVLWGGDMGR